MKKNVAKNIFVWSMIILLAFSSGIFLAQMYLELQDTKSTSAEISPSLESWSSDNDFTFSRWTQYNSSVRTYGQTLFFNPIINFTRWNSGNLTCNINISLFSNYEQASKSGKSFTYYWSDNGSIYNRYIFEYTSSQWCSDLAFFTDKQMAGYYEEYSTSGTGTRTHIADIWFGLTYNHGSEDGLFSPVYIADGYMNRSDLSLVDYIYCPSDLFGSSYTDKLIYYVSYVDGNNSSLTFFFAVDWLDDYNTLFYSRNITYTGSANQNSIDYTNGYNAGLQAGNNTGYDLGYDNGYDTGYNAGHSQGVLDSNEYSFLGLLGAVVDAPIAAFTGLFNFSILGVNLKDFLAGLFTICIVIVVVRLILVK